MSRDAAYLLDILLAAKDTRDFTAGLNKDAFLSDRKCQYAVIHRLGVLGVAVKHLSDACQRTYPDISWSVMARMRDLLIHAYGRVNVNEVWYTVQHEIPGLISRLERIVPPEDET